MIGTSECRESAPHNNTGHFLRAHVLLGGAERASKCAADCPRIRPSLSCAHLTFDHSPSHCIVSFSSVPSVARCVMRPEVRVCA